MFCFSILLWMIFLNNEITRNFIYYSERGYRMKKLLSMILCLCMVLSVIPSALVSAEAGMVEKLTFTAPVPIVNQKPNTAGVSLAESNEVDIVSVECRTEWGVDYFLEGKYYSYKIIVRVKDGVDKILSSDTVVTVNGIESGLTSFSNDNKQAMAFMRKGLLAVKASDSNAVASNEAQPVVSLYFTLDKPVAWQYASKKVTVEQDNQVEVTDVKWNGIMWNSDGTFMQNARYDVDVTVRIKSGVNMYFDAKAHDFKSKGAYVKIKEVSQDKKQAVVNIDVGNALSQKDIDKKEAEKEEAEKRKGTAVDKLEPGDSGSVFLMGMAAYYSQPKDDNSLHVGTYSTSDGAILEIVEAYVPSINRENEYYHAIKVVGREDAVYVEADPKKGTYSEYYKTGSNSDRPYAEKWKSKIKIGDPIAEMDTWLLKFEDG